jgi:glycosyltransferase involved in cell wall biosynthesis
MEQVLRVLVIVQSHYLDDPRPRRDAEALVGAGYAVDVVSLRAEGEPASQVVTGVKIYGIPLRRKFGGKARYLLEYGIFLLWAGTVGGWLHLRHRYQLIHIHNLPDTLVLAALFPKLLGARVVFDAHEAMPESLRIKYGWSGESAWTRLIIALERLCMDLADHILTIHEPMRQLFIRRGLAAEKVSVVMNWPDESVFRYQCGDATRAKDAFTLVYAGTIAERYGLQTAIRALPQLTQEIPHLRLRILGQGDYSLALRRLCRDLNVEDRMSIEAAVPYDEIASVYRSANVGISPQNDALFGDIYFSTKVAEYLAVGLPAVVARTRVMAEYYDDSQVAFFTPGDHADFAARVMRLFKDKAYKDRLVENGLKLSERYCWSREREVYLSIVNKLVGVAP